MCGAINPMKFIVPQNEVTQAIQIEDIIKWISREFLILMPTLCAVISPHSRALKFIPLKTQYKTINIKQISIISNCM